MENLEPDLSGTTVVPFAWNKLKLLRDDWEVSPREVRDIAPDHVAKSFKRPGQFRLSKEEAEFACSSEPVTPYWDVKLAQDTRLRDKFFIALRLRKLLSYPRKVHSFVGLFFVIKKG